MSDTSGPVAQGAMHQDTVYNDSAKLVTTESGRVMPVLVQKPWGHETLLVVTERYAMKLLHIEPGHRLSKQYHEKKEETLHCLGGRGKIFLRKPGGLDLEELAFEEGMTFHVAPLTVHTYQAETAMLLLETSTPELEDVIRLEDRYGRVGGKA